MGSLCGPTPPAAMRTTPANATPMPIMSDLGNPSFSTTPATRATSSGAMFTSIAVVPASR